MEETSGHLKTRHLKNPRMEENRYLTTKHHECDSRGKGKWDVRIGI